MVECIKFKSYSKGTTQGFADIYVEKWGVEIPGFTLHMKDGKRWVNLPSKEYKNNEGEIKHTPFFRFRNRKHYDLFHAQVKKSIDKYCLENADKFI